jgi:type I restriction enzyme M protein
LSNNPLEVELVQTELGSQIDGSFFQVNDNDILLARLGPTIQNAKFVLCPQTQRQTVASSEFLVLRCHPDWLPEAVLAVLRTKLYRDLMYSKSRGATPSRYRLNAADFAKLPFPVISYDLQEQIAAESVRRRNEVRRLRQEAEAGWQAAKRRFEEQLLMGDAA